jgi:hypothetical protein
MSIRILPDGDHVPNFEFQMDHLLALKSSVDFLVWAADSGVTPKPPDFLSMMSRLYTCVCSQTLTLKSFVVSVVLLASRLPAMPPTSKSDNKLSRFLGYLTSLGSDDPLLACMHILSSFCSDAYQLSWEPFSCRGIPAPEAGSTTLTGLTFVTGNMGIPSVLVSLDAHRTKQNIIPGLRCSRNEYGLTSFNTDDGG